MLAVFMMLICVCLVCVSQAQFVAYTPTSSTGNDASSTNIVYGMDFDVISAITIYQIGAFNNNGPLTTPIQVAIYNRTSQIAVSGLSVTLSSMSTTVSGFISFYTLSPMVSLAKGSYCIAAIGYTSTFRAGNVTTAASSLPGGSATEARGTCLVRSRKAKPRLAFVGSRYLLSSSGSIVFPTTVSSSFHPAAYGAGTFSYFSATCESSFLAQGDGTYFLIRNNQRYVMNAYRTVGTSVFKWSKWIPPTVEVLIVAGGEVPAPAEVAPAVFSASQQFRRDLLECPTTSRWVVVEVVATEVRLAPTAATPRLGHFW